MTDDKALEILRGINPEYYFYEGMRADQKSNPGLPKFEVHKRWLDPTSTENDPPTLRLNGSFTPDELLALAHFHIKKEQDNGEGPAEKQ